MAIGQQLWIRIGGDAKSYYRTLGGVKRMTARAAADVAALGVAGAAFSVKRAADFSKQLADLNTIARFSREGLQRFGEDVLDLSAKMGIAKSELTEGLYQALSGGVPREALLGFGELAVRLSRIGRGSVAEATEVLVRLRKAYPDRTDAELAGMAFRTVETGIITIADLGANIGKLTGTARSAGIGVEELMAAISTLSGQTSPEETMTAINAAIQKLVDASPKLREVYKKMGVESGYAAIQQLGFVGTLLELEKRTGSTLPVVQQLVTNLRAQRGILGLVGTQGHQTAKTMQLLADSATVVGEAYNRWELDNKALQFAQMKESMDNIAITAGGPLLDALGPLIEQFGGWLRTKDNVESMRATIESLAATLGSAAAFAKSLFASIEALTGKPFMILMNLIALLEHLGGKGAMRGETDIAMVATSGGIRGLWDPGASEFTARERSMARAALRRKGYEGMRGTEYYNDMLVAEMRSIRELLGARLPQEAN